MAKKEEDLNKKKEMFKTGDIYRDKLLNDFGVKIEDKTNLWKFFDKDEVKEKIEIPEVFPPEDLYKDERPLVKFKSYEKDE